MSLLKKLTLAVTLILLAIAGYISFSPVSVVPSLAKNLIAERTELDAQPDLGVVLGAGLKPDGSLTDLAQERVEFAMSVYNEKGLPLLFSGGDTPYGVEAGAMIKEAKRLGYTGPEHHEGSSTSTYENALFTKDLLDEGRVADDHLLIMTSPYHTERALSTFMTIMPNREISIDYPDDSVIYRDGIIDRWKGLRMVLREYLAQWYYQIRFGIKS